ncbi:hypothetical protein LRR18_18280, partial [Mangrovimonas sp. AS39]|uniref:hypothetical protein n=1 Tax=Mangrovimonas futianensis TaxID=2895523 RepID=UPI001E34012A
NRVKSQLKDWALHPSQCASLDTLLGEPANTDTANDGIAKITTALTANNFMTRQDITIRWFPLSKNIILYDLKVKVTPTQLNNNSREIGFSFIYDS